MSTALSRPEPSEYNPYFEHYISLVPEGNLIEHLERQLSDTLGLLLSIDEEKASGTYAAGKWTIKEVVGHVIDAERIFGYRALRFGRNDTISLEGFEQDDYVLNGGFNYIPLKDLALEFEHVRRANILYFRHLDDAAWTRSGVANGNPVSVRALAYMIAGHELHHTSIIKEKYLNSTT